MAAMRSTNTLTFAVCSADMVPLDTDSDTDPDIDLRLPTSAGLLTSFDL